MTNAMDKVIGRLNFLIENKGLTPQDALSGLDLARKALFDQELELKVEHHREVGVLNSEIAILKERLEDKQTIIDLMSKGK